MSLPTLTIFSIITAFVSRILVILLACFIYSSNRFVAIFEAVKEVGLTQSWPEFPWLEPKTLISWTLAPLIENLILMLIFIIGEKLKLNYIFVFILILVTAFFTHGMGVKGATSIIAFFAFSIVYVVTLEFSKNSHLKALIFSTITHSIYNFTGFYILALYQ